MPDVFTETTSRSWFSRMGNSFAGVIFGIVLFLGAFVVLWTNEGRSVQTAQALDETKKTVISLAAPEVKVENEGKLVHLTGAAQTSEVLQDPQIGVKAAAIKLVREVEMYQWVEKTESKTKDKIGGGQETTTTYTYVKEWSSNAAKSSDFKHPAEHLNPPMNYSSDSYIAKDVALGQFKLSPGLIGRIGVAQDLTLTDSDLNALSGSLQYRAQLIDSYLYIGGNGAYDPAESRVGDYRIRYRIAPPEVTVSIISKQIGSTFEPYSAKNGRLIELLQTGAASADSMVQAAQAENKMFTWILRLVGFIMMFIGLTTILKPLATAGAVLPLLGRIIGAGSGFIAFLVALGFSLITIAIAWVAARPLLGVSLLVAAALAIFLAGRSSKAKSLAAQTPK
jgi:hypothetical protein